MPPGQEGKITLGIDHTESYAGEVAKSASVSTNDPKYASFSLTLRAYFKQPAPPPGAAGANKPAPAAKIAGPFSISPNDRWVTSVITGSSVSTNMFLYNHETAPISIKKIEPGGDNFTASFQAIEEGKRYQMMFKTNPTLKPGQYTQNVRVLTDSASFPEFTIRLDVTVFPQVFVSPTSIILPKLPLASDITKITVPMVYVRKVREGGLKILKASSTLPFLKLEVVTETEGQFYTVRISLDQSRISGPGDFKGTIRIETNDAQNPVLEVPFQCSFM